MNEKLNEYKRQYDDARAKGNTELADIYKGLIANEKGWQKALNSLEAQKPENRLPALENELSMLKKRYVELTRDVDQSGLGRNTINLEKRGQVYNRIKETEKAIRDIQRPQEMMPEQPISQAQPTAPAPEDLSAAEIIARSERKRYLDAVALQNLGNLPAGTKAKEDRDGYWARINTLDKAHGKG